MENAEHDILSCPYFELWTDEIGALIVYLDHEIAKLTEERAVLSNMWDDWALEQQGTIEAQLEVLENVRSML